MCGGPGEARRHPDQSPVVRGQPGILAAGGSGTGLCSGPLRPPNISPVGYARPAAPMHWARSPAPSRRARLLGGPPSAGRSSTPGYAYSDSRPLSLVDPSSLMPTTDDSCCGNCDDPELVRLVANISRPCDRFAVRDQGKLNDINHCIGASGDCGPGAGFLPIDTIPPVIHFRESRQWYWECVQRFYRNGRLTCRPPAHPDCGNRCVGMERKRALEAVLAAT